MDELCHAKFANQHCWFDALALIMRTESGGSLRCLSECRTSYAVKTTWF